MSIHSATPAAAAGRPAYPATAVLSGHRLGEYLVNHYDELLRGLGGRLGSRDLAAESLHETWLRLRVGLPSDEEVCCPAAYVRRMAYCVALDALRADRVRGVGAWRGDDDATLDAMPDEAPGPEAIVAGRTRLARLIAAIERLPRLRQAIFLASKVESLSQRAVATRFGVSVVTVRTELRKADEECARALNR